MMYQRKEKSERIGPDCPEGMLDLFRLLESPDAREVESVKSVIHENLSSVKDSRLLNCIVDYYMDLQSDRSLDILVRVKDPHDKHLFDKINELMKSENTCYQSLELLCNLVYRQPTWIHKIANHRLMHNLFHLLKSDFEAPNLISALLIIVCLLPMIPSQFGPYLQDAFNVFSRLIAWNIKKPSNLPETFVLHLQVGVYSLFHRLYGMFPCNFLAYLRSYYGGRDYNEENLKIFSSFIKPMLERVRLHPLLVTASKETELNKNRWKKMEYHDVIIECASISLDAIEGTLGGLGGKNQNLNSAPRRHSNLCAQNSLQYISLSSQSSFTSASVEQSGLVIEAISAHKESLSHIYGTASTSTLNKATTPLTSKTDLEIKSPRVPEEPVPFDLAVEAKPEELKEICLNLHSELTKTPSKDLKLPIHELIKESAMTSESVLSCGKRNSDASVSELIDSNLESSILLAIEAKEEDVDKEVSELTSSHNNATEGSPCEVRHDTPFCSTTQNLTDEPQNLAACATENAQILAKSHDEDVDEMYNSMQDPEEDNYVPPYSRFRYMSHCGPPPVIPPDCNMKPKVTRSRSCPAKFCPSSQSSSESGDRDACNVTSQTMGISTCNASVITTTGAFISRNLTYENLLPMAMEPLPDITRPANASLESNYHSYNLLCSSLSPPELLDSYVQLGSETYLTQNSSIPITSTKSIDWTHFGGKPPPDEVEILRKQILLLHSQLLFERHRKDVHSERIRRILGRAKKSKMQEELIVALKEQINLLEKDTEDLKHELSNKNKLLDHFKSEKKQIESELNNLIVKVKLENTQLQFANKKLQNLLVTQKEENDKIIADSTLYGSKIVELDAELGLYRREVECCRKLKRESEFLSKQLFLLQEINNLYKEKIDRLKMPFNQDVAADLIKETALVEINELKMKLESTCFHLDAAKSKVAELEEILAKVKLKDQEHNQIIEKTKLFYEEEMKVYHDRLSEMKKIIIYKDSQILQLYKEKEMLSKKLKSLEEKLNSGSVADPSSCRALTYSEKPAQKPASDKNSQSQNL